MPLDPEIPIPLILEQLRGNTAWVMMRERIEHEIELRTRELTNLPPDTSAAAVQRVVGQIESLRWVLNRPEQLKTEWDRAQRRANEKVTRAT